MQNGDVQRFVDDLYYGEELLLRYDNRKFFIQGWKDKETYYMEMTEIEADKPDGQVIKKCWSYSASTMRECADAFLNEPLWDGKTFWQAESDMIQCDWWT